MGLVGPLGRNLHCFVSLGMTKSLGFSERSVYTEVVLLHNTLNYASTANNEKVMKFYYPFEIDFRRKYNNYSIGRKEPLFFFVCV